MSEKKVSSNRFCIKDVLNRFSYQPKMLKEVNCAVDVCSVCGCDDVDFLNCVVSSVRDSFEVDVNLTFYCRSCFNKDVLRGDFL